jgi:predicted nuclease of predicted toxin-antitoxin system
MKVLVDMNLSPLWVAYLADHGIDALHWSSVGDPRAKDSVVMGWAREHGYIVFTHDLDFSALLATTGASGPSVLQVRTQDVLPSAIGGDVVRVLREQSVALQDGAVVTLDEAASRIRVLPIRGRNES